MPKKRTDGMQKMTIVQQQEVIERFRGRKDVRDANRELARLVLAWVVDHPISNQEFMKIFEATGHEAEYHEVPNITTGKRVVPQAGQLPNITKRLSDTPLDYMGAIELSYVYQRIQQMIEILEMMPRSTMQVAIELYSGVGEIIRLKVLTETGHYPEEFPAPHGIRTFAQACYARGGLTPNPSPLRMERGTTTLAPPLLSKMERGLGGEAVSPSESPGYNNGR